MGSPIRAWEAGWSFFGEEIMKCSRMVGTRPGEFAGEYACSGGLPRPPNERRRLSEARNETPRTSRGVSGYREERYVCCWRWVGGTQAPRGALNRVEAASATSAAPMPTKKTAGSQVPVMKPTVRPATIAKVASA